MENPLVIGIGILAVLLVFSNLYILRKLRWIHLLSSRTDERVLRGFRHLSRQIQIMDGLKLDLGFRKSLPPAAGMAATPDFLKALADHVAQAKPKVIVECGGGLSTIIAARCLQIEGGGHVYSLDHIAKFADATRKEIERQGLSDFVSVIHAPLQPCELKQGTYSWYRTADIPDVDIDLLIVDGPPESTGETPRYPAGPILFPRLTKGVVLVDDVLRGDDSRVIHMWRKEFPGMEFEVDTQNFEKGICIGRFSGGSGSHREQKA